MSKADQKIIVVENKILFSNGNYFQGFKEAEKTDYELSILKNLKIMRRGSTLEPANHPEGNSELDFNHKQPIGYMLVVNPETKKVFAYQRSSKDEHYTEKRLQGKWSWGVGGHVEPCDGVENPIRESRLRELTEEIIIEGETLGMRNLGYINDDTNDVGKVHFGILYLVEIKGYAKPKDNEMGSGHMISLRELEEICNSQECDVETWSRIAVEPLKRFLQ
ncbi:MAG: NUDIX domain-containing protein [Nanoarchaeota archaeon]|nr:NUDIX domain-containing protein [Nanoarchaeota archaeon]